MAHAAHQPVESFFSHPDRYKHWTLSVDGAVATMTLDIEETNGLRSTYLLKQNSYDLSVDIELHDAVERLRFEHPAVRTVIVTSGQPKVFCAGANIQMLASSTHHFKVNFCKYTNETRGGMEEASRESGLTWIAALNGTAAGGGYELALACDEMYLIDDRSSAVSLPEVPLLGVLPGTGGLTRLVDKRKVRRDLADVFCTKAEGFRARDAVRLGFVDGTFKRSKWDASVAALAAKTAARSAPRDTDGIVLADVKAQIDEDGGRTYAHVRYAIDPVHRTATIVISAPSDPPPADAASLRAQGSTTWSFQAFRELEDALLHLRFNHPEIGLLLLKSEGDASMLAAHDQALRDAAGSWFADELIAFQARVLRRLDNMAKSMFAIVDAGSCFVGPIAELLFSADRSYMLDDPDGLVTIQLSAANGGTYPMATGISRLHCRFMADPSQVDAALEQAGAPMNASTCDELGLVTAAPDDIDWDDEVRIAVEERISLSPDALTGMEQNLRFVGAENCDTKIYGRLTAWQNWIFQRPNAVGTHGALTLYGHPEQPRFDWGRT